MVEKVLDSFFTSDRPIQKYHDSVISLVDNVSYHDYHKIEKEKSLLNTSLLSCLVNFHANNEKYRS